MIERRSMARGNLSYWMIFQVGLGIWLMISPLALQFREISRMALNDVILGALVTILGLMVAIMSLTPIGTGKKKTT
jgi:hypothetical protein